MRIVATSNVNANLVRAKLLPLLALPEVTAIVWVADRPGPPLPRVRYVAAAPDAPATPGGPATWNPRKYAAPGGTRLRELRRRAGRTLALAAVIARERPALVMGLTMNPHGVLAFGLGRLLGRRTCIHLISGPNEIIGGGYRVDPHVPRPNRRLEDLYLGILRHTDVVVVVGSSARRYLLAHGVAARRVHVISSKIDPARFHPVPGTPPRYDLIMAAAQVAGKRVDLFLQVVADLKARYPGIRAGIAGDGPLRGAMERLAGTLGLGETVEFLGFREDLEHYYTAARVFVLTSASEGLSLAMMEAMACGLPAVVSAVGDLGDLVRDGVTGYLVHPPERTGFVTAISQLLDDAALRGRLGAAAVQAVEDGYTVEAGARAWRAVLAPWIRADGARRPGPRAIPERHDE